jgi:mRNA interferase RelE/StbE
LISDEGRRLYRVELKPSAERDLNALQRRDRVRVARRIDALAADPRPSGVEELKGAQNLWRVRTGDYRIIFAIQDDVLVVLVIRIGHRRDVYR